MVQIVTYISKLSGEFFLYEDLGIGLSKLFSVALFVFENHTWNNRFCQWLNFLTFFGLILIINT
jgi:hypothetical protein